ncbi:MAG TPA: hypothetical protein VMZ04_05710 [Anaerolineae bacterium]|nr:hypothetical protein [Anaerolineae bacterium]
MAHEPFPEDKMNKINKADTICATLRDIYNLTDNEEIKILSRIATTMAKKMNAKLERYKKNWDKGFW